MDGQIDNRTQFVAQRSLSVDGRIELCGDFEIGQSELRRAQPAHQLLMPGLQLREGSLLLESVKRLLDEHLDISRLNADAI